MKIKMKDLGIYIHIPFCIKKCDYCDFLSFPMGDEAISAYLEALQKEIYRESAFYKEFQVATIFFGGGTPSILKGDEIVKVMDRLRENFAFVKTPEITLEMNPGTVTEEKLYGYQMAGVNRVSIGLQAAQNDLLKRLGRIHTYEDFLHTWSLVEKAGFQNRNIDLMSALPGQSVADYRESLRRITELGAEHISAYSLILEEGTPFYDRYQENVSPLPDEDGERAMYESTLEVLSVAGYHRYEISNYAREGYECRHNLTYWTGKDYVGFGLGASSMADHTRWKNISDFGQYLRWAGASDPGIRQDITVLSEVEQQEEFMFLGLRRMEGVLKSEFRRRFGTEMEEIYGAVLEKHAAEGLLVNGSRVYLTERGIDVSNYVLADFLQK